ncbi:Bromodomain-containing protein [Cunninghamella echinulata]|nr:Bromodomain-containing protein [Cunninghamella echinulata]
MASQIMHSTTLPHSPKEKKSMVEELEPIIKKEETLNPTNTLPSPAAEPIHTIDDVIEKPLASSPAEKVLPPPLTISNTTFMTKDQIRYAAAIIRNLKKHRDAAPFLQPVDVIKMNCPDYPMIVTRPMDLNTVDRKLNQLDYHTVDDFIMDVRLIFSNCYKYNGPEATVSLLCQNVESAFEKGLRQMPPSKELSPPLTGSPRSVDGYKRKSTTTTPTMNHFRLGSEEVRPKREIHPPPSKDYPETLTKKRNPYAQSTEMKFCIQTLKELKKSKYSHFNYPFLQPVDPVALNIPDYPLIIKEPMDLSTIEHKLNEGLYVNADEFEKDIRLTFSNCYVYNSSTLPVYQMAKSLEHVFNEKWKQKPLLPSPPPPPSTSEFSTPPASQNSHPSTPTHTSSTLSSATTTTTATKSRSRKRASSTSAKSVPKSKKVKYESSSDDDDDEEEDDRIAQLERHLANIMQQVQSMKSHHKRSSSSSSSSHNNNKKSTATKNRKRALSDVTHKKSLNQQHVNNNSDNDKKPKKNITKKNNNNANGGEKRKRRVNKKSTSSSLPLPEFTFEQKKQLSEAINNLTGDRLNTVVNIIQSSMPNLDGVRYNKYNKHIYI